MKFSFDFVPAPITRICFNLLANLLLQPIDLWLIGFILDHFTFFSSAYIMSWECCVLFLCSCVCLRTATAARRLALRSWHLEWVSLTRLLCRLRSWSRKRRRRERSLSSTIGHQEVHSAPQENRPARGIPVWENTFSEVGCCEQQTAGSPTARLAARRGLLRSTRRNASSRASGRGKPAQGAQRKTAPTDAKRAFAPKRRQWRWLGSQRSFELHRHCKQVRASWRSSREWVARQAQAKSRLSRQAPTGEIARCVEEYQAWERFAARPGAARTPRLARGPAQEPSRGGRGQPCAFARSRERGGREDPANSRTERSNP